MVIGKRDAKLRVPTKPNSADAGETALNTERPPLNEVRKKLRINWYRSPLATDQLRGLALRSNLRGAFQAVGHIGLWACTGALTCYAFTQGAWIAFAVCLFLHGTIGTFLKGIAVHELGHGTVFRTKKLNGLFLRIYSIVGWWNFYDYAVSHTYHHRYTLPTLTAYQSQAPGN